MELTHDLLPGFGAKGLRWGATGSPPDGSVLWCGIEADQDELKKGCLNTSAIVL